MSGTDFVTIAPLVAAVLVAGAILVVDLIAPGRNGPAIFTALVGLAVVAGLIVTTGLGRRVRGLVPRRRAHDVPRPAVRRDRGADDRLRARLPRAARPAGGRVRRGARVRDVGGDAHRRLHGPAGPVHRPRAHGPAGLHAGRLRQARRALDRGRDQVLPAGVLQLGDLPVRARVRVGPDRHDARRRRGGSGRASSPRRSRRGACLPASPWASRS